MRQLPLCCLLVAAVPTVASAYEVKQTDSGEPVRWDDPEIGVTLDLRQDPDDIATSDAEAAVARAFQTYEDLLGVAVDLSSAGGPELSTGPSDRMNVVRWITAADDEEMDPAALAVTRTTYLTSSGGIVDADIVINATDYHWTTELAGSDGCDNLFDIENILAHEIGHFFGLGHSEAKDATMFPRSGRCETSKRDLSEDDIAGLDELYQAGFPVAGPTDPMGQPGDEQAATVGCGMMSVAGGRGGLWTAIAIGIAIAFARRRGSRHLAGAAITAGILSVAVSAWAGIARDLPLAELGRSASLVVRGDVVDARSFRRGDLVYTDSVIAVRECWKSGSDCPAEITVRQLGGEADGIGTIVEGVAELTPGSEAVLFVRLRRDGAFAPVGMAQGVFLASQDRAGRVRYVRDLRGLDLASNDQLRAGSLETWTLNQLRASMAEIEKY